MAKNIILLSDGTGNSAASAQKTNIWRIYRALDLTTEDQVAIYDDGVGTSSFRPLAITGQGFGLGLARNVRDLYTFLSVNYKKGDRIYAFGFSRGAFTIRLLIGFVRHMGLVDNAATMPKNKLRAEVYRRYRAYRKRFKRRTMQFTFGINKRARYETRTTLTQDKSSAEGVVPDFTFVGLWDTVDAYVLPIDELKYGIDLWVYPMSMPDRRLSRIVKCAYHAISVDDERRTFHPLLWDEVSEGQDPKLLKDRLKQVWFAGVHSNVGGGYPKDGMAYHSLEWMIQAPELKDLKLHKEHVDEIKHQVDLCGELYDSRAGLAGYYRYSPRNIEALCDDDFAEVTIKRPKIHESVFQRVKGEHVKYAPIGIPPDYDLVQRDGTIVTRAEDKQKNPAKSVFPETEGEAALRAERMEAAWNFVWWGRLVYILTVLASLYLAALPWLMSSISLSARYPGLNRYLEAYLTPLLKASKSILPDIAARWIDAFIKEPILFLIGAIAVIATMAISAWLRAQIASRSTQVWSGKFQGGKIPPWAQNAKSGRFYRFRTNERLVKWYRAFAREILPTLAILAVAILLIWLPFEEPRVLVAYIAIVFVIWVRNIVWRTV